MSAWISENPIAKSGRSARMRSIFELVNAETLGFSFRARGGRTVKPEMPTMRSCSPSAYRTSVGSSVRETMRRGPCDIFLYATSCANRPWCLAPAAPFVARRLPSRDAPGISRRLRLAHVSRIQEPLSPLPVHDFPALPLVQAMLVRIPELHHVRHHEVSAPIRRPRHGLSGEPALGFRHPPLQRGAVRQGLRLQ